MKKLGHIYIYIGIIFLIIGVFICCIDITNNGKLGEISMIGFILLAIGIPTTINGICFKKKKKQ